jgi:AcrR family transcriptional regulator
MRVTADVKEATRKRILEASQKLFARQGFEATTTRDIAHASNIAVGTLFNYFPTKESVVDFWISNAFMSGAEAFAAEFNRDDNGESQDVENAAPDAAQLSLEEDLFSYIAVLLRKLKPYRKYLPAVLETSLSTQAASINTDKPTQRDSQMEIIYQIASRHGLQDGLSPVATQLYWTLFTGILAFWANDRSPRQEDTLALVDQSLSMFVGWLIDSNNSESTSERQSKSSRNER